MVTTMVLWGLASVSFGLLAAACLRAAARDPDVRRELARFRARTVEFEHDPADVA